MERSSEGMGFSRLAITESKYIRWHISYTWIILNAIIILLFLAVTPCFCEHITGSLVIGEQKYIVDGQINRDDKLIVIDFAARQGKNVINKIKAFVSTTYSYYEFNDIKYPLSNERAMAWRQQINSGFISLIKSNNFSQTRKDDTMVYDSEGLIEISDSLPGKLRLVYQSLSDKQERKKTGEKKIGRLISIRFFSLAEWNNCFHNYVALSLDFL